MRQADLRSVTFPMPEDEWTDLKILTIRKKMTLQDFIVEAIREHKKAN